MKKYIFLIMLSLNIGLASSQSVIPIYEHITTHDVSLNKIEQFVSYRYVVIATADGKTYQSKFIKE